MKKSPSSKRFVCSVVGRSLGERIALDWNKQVNVVTTSVIDNHSRYLLFISGNGVDFHVKISWLYRKIKFRSLINLKKLKIEVNCIERWYSDHLIRRNSQYKTGHIIYIYRYRYVSIYYHLLFMYRIINVSFSHATLCL